MRKLPSAKRTELIAATSLLALLAGFGALLALLPLRTAVQIGADEGLALSKAVLYANGYKFYSEVWNDQPLLHTFLIAQITKHVSASILGPRLLTSAFAALLLASVFGITRRLAGLSAATLATAFLIASPAFLALSSSCMVEVPALAVHVAALGLLLFGAHNSDCASTLRLSRPLIIEVVAGALFGIGLHIKFNGAIYLPLAGLILWRAAKGSPSLGLPSRSVLAKAGREGRGEGEHPPTRRSFWLTLATFATALVASFAAVHTLIGEGSYLLQFQQSWAAHVAAPQTAEYGSPEEHPFPWDIFLKNWDITVPALLGVFLLLRNLSRRHRVITDVPGSARAPADLTTQRFNDLTSFFPVVWLALTLLVFVPHKPWWPYYYLHLSVPLCICAAIALCRVWTEFRSRLTRALLAAILAFGACALVWMGMRVHFEVSAIRESPQLYSCLALKEIEPLKPFTRYLFTDQPIYSFHSGIPIPPKLAMITLKRLWSGELTNTRVVEELLAAKPEILLLHRDTRGRPYDRLLQQQYRLIYEDDELRLYALAAVAERASP